MQPGERITLIKKIAARLANEHTPELRLTLGQFGLDLDPYFPEPGIYDSYESAIRSIEDATDETLVSLHNYLFGERVPTSTKARSAEVASEIWTPNALRLFISHTSAHKREMGILRDALQYVGISGFVAHTDIHPTREWQGVIESALETCDALAAYLTDDFHQSLWTDQEVGFCMAHAILIIPIKAGRDPYGFIGKYQALDGIGKELFPLAQEIADVAVDHPLTAKQMARPTALSFARSNTYDEARANLTRLMKIPIAEWTAELVELVDEAVDDNSQLREAVARTSTGWRPIPEIVREMLGALPSR